MLKYNPLNDYITVRLLEARVWPILAAAVLVNRPLLNAGEVAAFADELMAQWRARFTRPDELASNVPAG